MRDFSCLYLALTLLHICSAFKATILHINDLHSRFDEVTPSGGKCKLNRTKCVGGVARIKHVADRIVAENPNTIFLNAGDFFQGTVWYSMFKWPIVVNLTSSLGLTASSLGNHEFDDGPGDLEAFVRSISTHYPLLACNLDLSKDSVLKDDHMIKPSLVKELANGARVAIIGYVTPETKQLSDTGKVLFMDEVASLRSELARLKAAQDIDLVIALGHSGYHRDLEIAKEVDGIDIIVGGHTNTFLWHGPEPAYLRQRPTGDYPTVVQQSRTRRNVLVLQTNGYGRYLGRLSISFDKSGVHDWSGNPVLLNQTYGQDAQLASQVAAYRQSVAAKMDTVVGTTTAYIDGDRPKCRLEECSFGNFVTDAMAAEMGVPMALINSGAIKGSFDPKESNGNITLYDVFTAIPWSNTIDVVTVRGGTLRQVLEHAVSEFDPDHPDPGGRFLQVSGLVLTYDITKPANSRLASLYSGSPDDRSGWEPIEDSRLYKLAVPSFLATGGDEFSMIPEQLTEYKNTGFLDSDLLVSYLKKHNPLTLPASGRIAIISSKQPGTTASAAQRLTRSPTLHNILTTITILTAMSHMK